MSMSIVSLIAVGGVLFIAKRLLADELAGRVNHIARGILWSTARFVPSPLRESVLREWRQWLDDDLERYHSLPVTKLFRTTWQCATYLTTIPQLRRDTRADRGVSPAGMLVAQAVVVGIYPLVVTMWMPPPISAEIAGWIWGATTVAGLVLLLTSRPRRKSRFESKQSDQRDPLSSRVLHTQFAVYSARIGAPSITLLFGVLWVSLCSNSFHLVGVVAVWGAQAALVTRSLKHDRELECIAGVVLMRRDHERRTKWSTRSHAMLRGSRREEPVKAWIPAAGATMYALCASAPVAGAVVVAQTGVLSNPMRLAMFSIALGPLTAVMLSAVIAFGRPALYRIDPLSNLFFATVYGLAGAIWALGLLSVLTSAAPDSWWWSFAAYLTITTATTAGLAKINLLAARSGTPSVITPIAASWIRSDQRYLPQG